MLDCQDAILVIAWGNPLREDDGVAWHVLEGLRRLRPSRELPALHLRHAHQLTPEMAEGVSRAAGVVFVDARRDGTPGEVRCDLIVPTAGKNPLAHSLSPEGLLVFAETIFGRAPLAALVSVSGERFGMGEELSPAVRKAVPKAIRTVLRQAQAWAPAASPSPSESETPA